MAYTLNKITDYDDDLNLILTQFQNSANLNGLVSAANTNANEIETALFEIRDEMGLDVAVGAQLDISGRVFNEDRQGRVDDDYRLAIKTKGATRYSGEPEAVISIIRSSFEATFVHYIPEYPAKYVVFTDIDLTFESLEPISPAGVGSSFGYPIVDEGGDFLVDEEGKILLALF